MNTVKYYKDAGLMFVYGDIRTSKCPNHGNVILDEYLAENMDALIDVEVDSNTIVEFAWRTSTGVKPDYVGMIEVKDPDGQPIEFLVDDMIWGSSFEWRPLIKSQPPESECALSPNFVDNENHAKTRLDAVIEFKGEWKHKGDDGIYYRNIAGANQYYYYGNDVPKHSEFICNQSQFNTYVDLLASNFGVDTQDYEDYKSDWEYEQEIKIKSKPVYTQAMCDAGELANVGMECQSSLGVVTIKYVGKEVIVSEDGHGVESLTSRSCALDSFKPLTPPKTDKEKAIDGILCTIGCKGAVIDSIYYKMAYRIYDAGYIKPLTVEGE